MRGFGDKVGEIGFTSMVVIFYKRAKFLSGGIIWKMAKKRGKIFAWMFAVKLAKLDLAKKRGNWI